MSRTDRHVVIGARGTAVISPQAVALIDAPPASEPAAAWEHLLFSARTEPTPLDPHTAIADELLTSFALVEATRHGTTVTRHGAASVEINNRPWTSEGPSAITTVGADDPITISLQPEDEPTGQWVSQGVLAAGTVVVGTLVAPNPSAPTMLHPVVDVAAVDADFGSLLAGPAPAAAMEAEPANPSPMPAEAPDPQATTAAFVHTEAIAPDAVVRTSDGRTFSVETPIVVGRRPPDDPIGTLTPQVAVVDDPMVSRHHATVLIVDGRLVVVDEGSTNGTTVHVPGEPPRRCAPKTPVEVPPGTTVDFAGALSATHEGVDGC